MSENRDAGTSQELRYFLMAVPGFRCCQCQRPLGVDLCALCTVADGPDGKPYQFAFIVCGKRCQEIGSRHLAQGGRVVTSMDARQFRRLMDEDQCHRIAGFGQFNTWNGIVVIEPMQPLR